MRILLVGASGTIGRAVHAALDARGHAVVAASREGEVAVDITDGDAIDAMYARVMADGPLEAVVCCAGPSVFKPLAQLTDEDLQVGLRGKLLAQVDLVRRGMRHVADGGSFTLTAGAYSQRPDPGVSAPAMVNGALESFARAAALDLPRGQRINVVSPGFVDETARRMGLGDGQLSAAEAAVAYVALVEGDGTGGVRYPGVPELGATGA